MGYGEKWIDLNYNLGGKLALTINFRMLLNNNGGIFILFLILMRIP